MSLKQWADNGWLVVHKTSRTEITNLMAIVNRDLADAAGRETSADWRFGIAYNAALKLCTIVLYASGYRAARLSNHYYTIAALPLVLGDGRTDDASYLDACRSKRNTVEYDSVGAVSEDDVVELLDFTQSFKKDVKDWLTTNHPELI